MKPNYAKSIVNIPATFLRYHHLKTIHPSLPVIERLLPSYKHTVLIVLDGFGVNLLDHLDDDAFLKKFYLMTLDSTFPSTTVAATTALLSGLTPYESGHVGWQQYLKASDTHYTVFLHEDFYDVHKPLDAKLKSLFHYPRALDRIQEKDADIATQYFFPKPIDPDGYETLSKGLKRYKKFQSVRAKTLSYVYSIEPDATEHSYGIHSEETARVVRKLNETIESFVHSLDQETLVLVTADHGLIDVSPVPILENSAIMSCLLRKPAIEPRATAFFVKDGMHDRFEAVFNAAYGEDFTLYESALVKKLGLLGYGKKHALVDETLGDYVAIAKTDKYFSVYPLKTDAFKAHHAGLTDAEMEVPLIVYAPKGLI